MISVNKKYIYSIFISYIVFLIYIYFWPFNFSYVKVIYNYSNSYSIEMFNLIPFKNIIMYLQNKENINSNIVIYNLLYPIIIWIPFGLTINIIPFFEKCMLIKKVAIFSFFLIMLFLLRVILLFGFFDVDKIILSNIGFIIGCTLYKISFKYIKYT